MARQLPRLGGGTRQRDGTKRGRRAPVTSAGDQSRIEVLDVIRGLAVFGILLMNMRFYSTPLQAIQWQVELWPGFWDRLTTLLLRVAVEGKFLSLFALLFGYSMVILWERTVERGGRFWTLWLRRMASLLILGLIHGLLIWYGDILFHYALLGVFLLLFHRRQPRTLLVWAVLFFVLIPFLLVFPLVVPPDVSEELVQEFDAGPAPEELEQAIAADTGVRKPRHRGHPAPAGKGLDPLDLQRLGLLPDPLRALSRRRELRQAAGAAPRRGAPRALGTPCRRHRDLGLRLHPGRLRPDPLAFHPGSWQALVVESLQVLVGAPLVALCYFALLARVFQTPRGERILRPLAAVGRLSLTNYIGQSVICTLIFYGYGLGLFGKAGPFAVSWLAVAIFAFQILWSRWWLEQYRIGPLEWLWRIPTYLCAAAQAGGAGGGEVGVPRLHPSRPCCHPSSSSRNRLASSPPAAVKPCRLPSSLQPPPGGRG